MIYSGLHAPTGHRKRSQWLAQDTRNLDIALRQNLPISPPDWQAARVIQARKQHEQGQSQAALQLLQQLKPTPSLSMMTLYAEIYTALQQYAQALEAYQYLLDHRDQFFELQPTDRLRMQGLTHMNMGWIEQQQTHWEQALTHYNEAIEFLGRLDDLHDPAILNSLLTAYQQRGQVHRQLNQTELSLHDLRHSMKYQQLLLSQDITENLVKDWLDLGQTQLLQMDLDGAQRSLEAARHDWQYLPLSEAELLVKPLRYFEAQLASATGDFERAGELYQKLADTSQTPLTKIRYQLLAIEQQIQHHSDTGIQQCQTLVPQILELDLPESNPTTSSAQEVLTLPLLAAAELCEDHEYRELALEYYQFALRAASQQQSDYWLQAAAGRARILEQQEDFTRAAQAYRNLLREITPPRGTATAESQAEFQLKLALCYQQAGKTEAAAQAFDQAVNAAATQVNKATKAPAQDSESIYIRSLYFRAFFRVLEQDNVSEARQDFEAIEVHLPGYAAYDLACLANRAADTSKAFEYLERHLSSGYALPFSEISEDQDRQSLHTDPRWQALSQQYLA